MVVALGRRAGQVLSPAFPHHAHTYYPLLSCHNVDSFKPQGVDAGDTAKVEALVLKKLQELSASGFTPSAIEAAVNTIEFSLRENNTGSFPRGLSLMLRAVGAWIYDRDPYVPIQVCVFLVYHMLAHYNLV